MSALSSCLDAVIGSVPFKVTVAASDACGTLAALNSALTCEHIAGTTEADVCFGVSEEMLESDICSIPGLKTHMGNAFHTRGHFNPRGSPSVGLNRATMDRVTERMEDDFWRKETYNYKARIAKKYNKRMPTMEGIRDEDIQRSKQNAPYKAKKLRKLVEPKIAEMARNTSSDLLADFAVDELTADVPVSTLPLPWTSIKVTGDTVELYLEAYILATDQESAELAKGVVMAIAANPPPPISSIEFKSPSDMKFPFSKVEGDTEHSMVPRRSPLHSYRAAGVVLSRFTENPNASVLLGNGGLGEASGVIGVADAKATRESLLAGKNPGSSYDTPLEDHVQDISDLEQVEVLFGYERENGDNLKDPIVGFHPAGGRVWAEDIAIPEVTAARKMTSEVVVLGPKAPGILLRFLLWHHSVAVHPVKCSKYVVYTLPLPPAFSPVAEEFNEKYSTLTLADGRRAPTSASTSRLALTDTQALGWLTLLDLAACHRHNNLLLTRHGVNTTTNTVIANEVIDSHLG